MLIALPFTQKMTDQKALLNVSAHWYMDMMYITEPQPKDVQI